MPKRVLILSWADDFHALAVQALLRRQGADADIVDPSEFPASIELAHAGPPFSEPRVNGRPISDYHSIWNRRAKLPRPPEEVTDPAERQFAARECEQAFWGALYAGGLPIYNRPDREKVASYKPLQLRVAHELGLRVPDTLVTTSADEASAFIERHPRAIYKTFGCPEFMMTETRPIAEADLSDLWRLRYAPVILQEYLERGREYRVSVVDGECFVAEIGIEHPGAVYDWRLDEDYETRPATLPSEVLEKLVALLAKLEVRSGAIDLRETPDGTIYFLEINPTGQFLFLDIFAGLPVGEAFCRMLLR